MTTPTGPGWYDDPQDPAVLRYYDGVLWTAHTTPKVSPTAASSTIGRGPEPFPAAPNPAGAPPSNPWAGAPAPGQPWAVRRDVLPDGAVLAEWWRRLVARILDWLLVGILTAIAAWPWLQDLTAAFGDYFDESVRAAEQGTTPDAAAFTESILDVVVPITVISLAVTLLYEVAFLLWRGATPGKILLGTRVRRVDAPGRLGLGTVLRRQAITVGVTAISLVPLLGLVGSLLSVLDPAWLLWDPRRQTLHDKVADTVVVMAQPTRMQNG